MKRGEGKEGEPDLSRERVAPGNEAIAHESAINTTLERGRLPGERGQGGREGGDTKWHEITRGRKERSVVSPNWCLFSPISGERGIISRITRLDPCLKDQSRRALSRASWESSKGVDPSAIFVCENFKENIWKNVGKISNVAFGVLPLERGWITYIEINCK